MDLDYIRTLKKQFKYTISDLSQVSGIPVGTLNKILCGETKEPKLQTIKSLCKALKCPADKLLGLNCDTELKQIKYVEKNLDSCSNKAVKAGSAKLKQRRNANIENKGYINRINHYKIDDANAFLSIQNLDFVFADNAPPETSYCITAPDDSMLPEFSKGDVLFVEKTSNLSKGQIGVFVLEGIVYVKRLGDNKLLSNNSSYPETEFHAENLNVCGKVLGKGKFIDGTCVISV